MSEPIIEIKGLKNYLGSQWVHSDVNLTVEKGEILAIIGGSGSGKTTILRSILMLLKPTAGTIKVFGKDIEHISEHEANALRQRWGMLFQHSALFSAMTVLENIMFPMRELASLDKQLMHELAILKLMLVGLSKETGGKFPAELSGGMQRRAAAARAIAMDPELLFLDEPTSGLDPLSAKQFDELILFLRNALNLTIVIVSHDIESLQRTTDRVAFVGKGKIISVEPIDKLMQNDHPLIADYFSKF
ncbi:ABC transporter ATP-binding protein [Legionella oakridgensis]|uniref:ABC-type transport system involved in resistance to organic solvents, ATPase component n=2 Tax=Legionella oakridgensis TaxID=29423 RepID=W0BHH3_9GAMM|nr:ATP-binding cassette domain-containing protein [Legionella oakridgensis]AHE68171.1 ABC-type transport system involved in resistance to organic solvents, ATPase component [Legionella oakridgensis ATCC 33761 = DSM 21215]ETO92260.1 ABC-type transport system involved in resistance to organic solvents, ATPase component [Legionella oakridgensis RV-2-2007]KTD39628.1 ABC transporter ATP binding protein [Legionella oakridgensis]STY21136.1 putative ABC transport system ATP-binding protein [Legionella 